MPFAYLRDPLFLACFFAYWVHKLLANYGYSTPLLRSYLNDVICIPFWIPIMLWAQRVLRLRNHDGPPQPHEIVIPLVIWAAVFEVILPATSTFHGKAVPDPLDVLCYAGGALVAASFWRWRYGHRHSEAA